MTVIAYRQNWKQVELEIYLLGMWKGCKMKIILMKVLKSVMQMLINQQQTQLVSSSVQELAGSPTKSHMIKEVVFKNGC